VRHGETGLVARSIEECPALLRTLLHDKPLRERLSANAAAHIATTRTPARSAEAFIALWRDMLAQAPRRPDFAAATGATPADWFLATQGEAWSPSPAADIAAAKGTLSHFKQVFEGDASLERLHATS